MTDEAMKAYKLLYGDTSLPSKEKRRFGLASLLDSASLEAIERQAREEDTCPHCGQPLSKVDKLNA